MSGRADYRKLNDGSLSSSTYHKKDGTNVRGMLKQETTKETSEALESKMTNIDLTAAMVAVRKEFQDCDLRVELQHRDGDTFVEFIMNERHHVSIPINKWLPDQKAFVHFLICDFKVLRGRT